MILNKRDYFYLIQYLDNEDNIYKECYPSCEICDLKGTDINHNCLKCDNYSFYELHKNNHINCYKQCEYYFYHIEDIDKYYCTPEQLCSMNISKLLIPQKNQCIDDCTKDSEYQYEFRHTCYKECPELISEISQTKNFYCEVICTKELPFEIIETQECTNNCTISQREKGFCKNNYQPKESEENKEAEKEVEQKAVENVKEELTQGFDTSNVDQGNNVVINQKGSTITISTTDNQKNDISSNTSTINLGDCEDKIKDEYNIPKNKSLYILKVDVVQDGLQIPKIEYEVYYPLFGGSLIKLNLTSCKDSKIDLSIPVKLNDDIDKINSSSNYYNDICYTYTSENGTDISLSDRKKDFVNKNLTVCEEDCDFIDYNYTTGKAICSCKVKTNSTANIMGITIDTDKLYKKFTNFKNIANINVLKCYNLIFSLEAYKSNYANLMVLSIIFLFFVCLIIFYCKDYTYLIEILNIIIYFKKNPKLVQKLNIKKKKEEEKERKKSEILEKNNNIINMNNNINNINNNMNNSDSKAIINTNTRNNKYNIKNAIKNKNNVKKRKKEKELNNDEKLKSIKPPLYLQFIKITSITILIKERQKIKVLILLKQKEDKIFLIDFEHEIILQQKL